MDQELTDVRIDLARSALLQRMARLERRVVGTTEDAVDQLKETASTVQTVIADTSTDIRDIWTDLSSTLRDSVDLTRVVRKHPWPSLGLVAAAGFVTGFLGHRGVNLKRDHIGIVSELMSVLRRELMNVGEATIAAGAAAIKQNLQRVQSEPAPMAAHHNGRV